MQMNHSSPQDDARLGSSCSGHHDIAVEDEGNSTGLDRASYWCNRLN